MFLNFNCNIWNRKTVNRLRGECTVQQIAILSSWTPNKRRNKLIKHSNYEKAWVKQSNEEKAKFRKKNLLSLFHTRSRCVSY